MVFSKGLMSDVSRILAAVEKGDAQAARELLPLVYDGLRKLAARRLAQEKPGQSLEPTALVHEAYLRLVGNDAQHYWDSRGHFFAAAAQAMRRILIENARRKRRAKHGGRHQQQMVDLDSLILDGRADELLVLDDALQAFSQHHPIKARLVELRYFGGMSLAEAAKYLEISPSTADRAWRYARAWLYAEMKQEK